MKNIKRIAYIVLIVIVVVLSLKIYTNASKDNTKDQKHKTFSQIKYEVKMQHYLYLMSYLDTILTGEIQCTI